MSRLGSCKACGRRTYVSQHGLCDECGARRFEETIRQLRERSGPIYERWRARIRSATKKSREEERGEE